MNDFIKKLFDLISSQKDVSIEEMQKYLAELKKTKGIEHLNMVTFDIVEVKAESGGLRLKAIASTPSIDRGNDIVIAEGISTENAKNGFLPMLHQHDADQQIGVWDKWGVVDGKFVVEGVVATPITEWQKDVYSRIESKMLNGISIGFIGLEVSILENEVRQFDKIELLEVSVVTIPMNQDCYITEVNGATAEKPSEEPAEGENESEDETPPDAEKSMTVKSEEQADAPPAEGTGPDNQAPTEPTQSDEPTAEALKETVGKLTQERDALIARVAELEAALAESDTLMEEAAEQNEELLKAKGVKV